MSRSPRGHKLENIAKKHLPYYEDSLVDTSNSDVLLEFMRRMRENFFNDLVKAMRPIYENCVDGGVVNELVQLAVERERACCAKRISGVLFGKNIDISCDMAGSCDSRLLGKLLVAIEIAGKLIEIQDPQHSYYSSPFFVSLVKK